MVESQQDSPRLAGGSLGGHRHVCGFFQSRDEQYRVLAPYVQEGLARGEKAIHIVDPALHEEHLGRLGKGGVDVAAALARRQLQICDWTDTYLPRGRFDREWTSARIQVLLAQARAAGFPRTRIIGSVDWAAEDPALMAAVIEYEAEMNDVLVADSNDPALCIYDRSRLPGGAMVDLLRAHPIAVLDGALRENPLFEPTSRLLSRFRGGTISVLRDRFLGALLAGARREALEILLEDGLGDDVPIARLYLDVVQAALHEIGHRWRHGRIGVDEEHAATEIARLALGQLHVHLPHAAATGRHVVVACVEGERHDLGARILADFLEMEGFEVQFLGADVPEESLVARVRRQPPDLLALSATSPTSAGSFRRAIAAVRDVTGGRLPIAVGGQLLQRRPSLARQLGIVFLGRDAQEGVAVIRRLLKREGGA